MKYEKPEVEVMQFDSSVFMAASGSSYPNGVAAFKDKCAEGYQDSKNTNQMYCSKVGGVTPQKQVSVTINGYTFIYHGNHWRCEIV